METQKNKIKTQTQHALLSKAALLISLVGLLASCAKSGTFDVNSSSIPGDSSQGSSSPGNNTSSTPNPAYKPQPLAWESSSHPERLQWSKDAMAIVTENFANLDKASDIVTFCPTYKTLTVDEKVNVWADLFAATAYYESAWNPASSSVDVGTASNKDTYSVGLLQMSVVDQANYKLLLGYDFGDLQTASANLDLGIAIMGKQIAKYGKILIPVGGSGLYWATLHPGGKYDQTAGIAGMVKKLNFCH